MAIIHRIGMPENDSGNLIRQGAALTTPDALANMINNADCGGLLGDVQSDIEGHRVAPIGLKPGANRPGRGTIGHPADRDYPMSTHGTDRPFAALQRFRLLSEGILP